MTYIHRIKKDLYSNNKLYYFLNVRDLSNNDKRRVQDVFFNNNIFWAFDSECTGLTYIGNFLLTNFYWIKWDEFQRRIVLTQSEKYIDVDLSFNMKRIYYDKFMNNEEESQKFINKLFSEVLDI